MSLIEQAAAEVRDIKTGRKLRRNRRRHESADQNREGTQFFSLDLKDLHKHGFYTPTERPQRLSTELRAIKRRLLRRLGFQKSVTGRHRAGKKPLDQKNIVLVTSTRPEEGKTFTAINLALSFALEDKINVILIDGDIPRPKVFSHLGVPSNKGITDKLINPTLKISELLIKEASCSLSLLSEGTHKVRGEDVFSSVEMGDFIAELTSRYSDHLIIIDAPPVLATADAIALANYVDEIVFVIEANKTQEPAAAAALEELIDINSNISVVLNRCTVSERSSQYGSYEEYYYRADKNKKEAR
ncbi:MAG: AAA family ATPase [bacterium]